VLPLLLQGTGRNLAVERHGALLTDPAGQHGQRKRDVAESDDPGEGVCEAVAPAIEPRMVPPQRLKQAPEAVIEVEAERQLGDDVEERDVPDAEAGQHVAAYVPRLEA